MSAMTAIVGFFIGVGIGTSETEANDWILAITAGVFLYIALVDLVSVMVLWMHGCPWLHLCGCLVSV